MKNEQPQAQIYISTFYRESTREWIGKVTITSDAYGTFKEAKFPGNTEEAARNAAFAMIGSLLMELTFDREDHLHHQQNPTSICAIERLNIRLCNLVKENACALQALPNTKVPSLHANKDTWTYDLAIKNENTVSEILGLSTHKIDKEHVNNDTETHNQPEGYCVTIAIGTNEAWVILQEPDIPNTNMYKDWILQELNNEQYYQEPMIGDCDEALTAGTYQAYYDPMSQKPCKFSYFTSIST